MGSVRTGRPISIIAALRFSVGQLPRRVYKEPVACPDVVGGIELSGESMRKQSDDGC